MKKILLASVLGGAMFVSSQAMAVDYFWYFWL